jgi:hypothetical protein
VLEANSQGNALARLFNLPEAKAATLSTYQNLAMASACADACEASGKRPIPANEFPAAIAALCKQLRIKIEDAEDGLFLLKVRIKQPGVMLEAEQRPI